jgi:hypothetical protein
LVFVLIEVASSNSKEESLLTCYIEKNYVYLSIDSSVAKLPDPSISNIFILQRSLVECLNAVTALEYRLFQQFGETPETITALDELQNIKERLVSSCSRLHNLLLRVCQSQPVAPDDMLNLLYGSMETGQASLDASNASLQDIQRNWN